MNIPPPAPMSRVIPHPTEVSPHEFKPPTPAARGPAPSISHDRFERLTPLDATTQPPPPPAAPTPKEVTEINRQHRARLVHKSVKIAGITAAVITGIGLIAALASAGPAIAFALGAGAVLTGLVVGIGALAGFIRSKTNPVTPRDITTEAPNAVAAKNFKRDPLVHRGVLIGGAIGGSSGAVFTITGILGTVGLAMGSSAGFTLAAGMGILLFHVAPMLGAVAIIIGLGALGGFIHSKIKAARRKNLPTGSGGVSPSGPPPPDDTSASKITRQAQIKKGATIGAIVGSISGALGIATWATALGVTTTVVVAETMILAGLAFLPVGFGALAAVAVGMGIGALVGYYKSRKRDAAASA